MNLIFDPKEKNTARMKYSSKYIFYTFFRAKSHIWNKRIEIKIPVLPLNLKYAMLRYSY